MLAFMLELKYEPPLVMPALVEKGPTGCRVMLMKRNAPGVFLRRHIRQDDLL
jgi:hypothetical protein